MKRIAVITLCMVLAVVISALAIRNLEGFKDGLYNRPKMMVVVRAVRFALVSPDENLEELKPPHIKHEVLRLGQEYGIDFRDHSGQIIGYNRIRIPEKVEGNKVVVFDLVANK